MTGGYQATGVSAVTPVVMTVMAAADNSTNNLPSTRFGSAHPFRESRTEFELIQGKDVGQELSVSR